MHYQLGPMLSGDGATPNYMQTWFHDTEYQHQHRATRGSSIISGNNSVRAVLFQKLYRIIMSHKCNNRYIQEILTVHQCLLNKMIWVQKNSASNCTQLLLQHQVTILEDSTCQIWKRLPCFKMSTPCRRSLNTTASQRPNWWKYWRLSVTRRYRFSQSLGTVAICVILSNPKRRMDNQYDVTA